jgi:hypothetical protein
MQQLQHQMTTMTTILSPVMLSPALGVGEGRRLR